MQGETAERILDVANALLIDRGYSAFSYADIASELQLTKAALHYHFAGKADLGEALISRYASRFAGALGRWGAEPADAAIALRPIAAWVCLVRGLYVRFRRSPAGRRLQIGAVDSVGKER